MRILAACSALVFLALALLTIRPAAAQDCRHALVLALDVSGSVNAVEYAQQIGGLAHALDSPAVRALILTGGAPVRIAVFEWSSQNHQYVIQPWVAITDAAALDALVARIRGHRKVRAGLKTAIGTALDFAATLLADQGGCLRRTVDISGDGKNNIGPTPAQIHALPRFRGITVNALVVGDPSAGDRPGAARLSQPELLRYFEAEVIHGPDAFAMIAEGYADYARAMRRKLLRELSLPVFGGWPGVSLTGG